MELKNIDENTFDTYVKESIKPHFAQTSAWAKVNAKRGLIPHLLGLYEDEKLVGCALLLERKILYYSTFYCPRGFIVDGYDRSLIKEMTERLKVYVKAHHGLSFKIDPDLIIRKLDNDDASIIYEDKENLSLIDYLVSLGYKHRGFTTRFSESSMPRFTFRVDISRSKEEIRASMHQTTRQILNRENPYGIKIRKNEFADFKAFYQTMVDTAKRKSILLEPLRFYETFYETLYQEDMSDLFSASIDRAKVIATYKKEIADERAKIDELLAKPNRKTENRIKDITNHINKMEKCLKEIEDIKDDEIILSAIITARFADKVWLIHGGNRDILQFLNANYILYNAIMMDGHERGYKVCDFYGAEGKIDKKSDLYGLVLFKSRFGGDYDEFIGEFDYIVRPIMHTLITRALIIRRKIRLHFATKKGGR